MFRQIPVNTHAIISDIWVCWFVYAEALFDFEKKHLIGKHLWWNLFMPATLLKSDSNTGAFLWILQNFQEQVLCATSVNRCFIFESLTILMQEGFTISLQNKSYGRTLTSITTCSSLYFETFFFFLSQNFM